jgi:hypothetical protein
MQNANFLKSYLALLSILKIYSTVIFPMCTQAQTVENSFFLDNFD